MTWIKICGITNLEDALMAVEAGADALGFVFYEKSPRYIDAKKAREIVSKLGRDAETVGVFVGSMREEFVETANRVGLKSIQIHDSANAAWEIVTSFALNLYPCLPMSTLLEDGGLLKEMQSGFAELARQKGSNGGQRKSTVFLDSSTREPGGTGKTFDWQESVPLVQAMRGSVDIVVAGGLTPENVAEAIRVLKPWGVDVSSGVEARPGKKDPETVRAFITAVRNADGIN